MRHSEKSPTLRLFRGKNRTKLTLKIRFPNGPILPKSLRIYRGGAVHPIHGDEARFWHGGPGRWMFEETQPSTAVLALSRLGSKNLKGEVMKLNVFC